MAHLGLTSEDIEDAISELRELVNDRNYSGYRGVEPTEELFAEYDGLFQEWRPESDALVVAANLVSKGMQMENAEEVAKQLGFEPRRMNPAIAWLRRRGLLGTANYAVGDQDYIEYRLIPTPELRRFVKSATLASQSQDPAGAALIGYQST